MVEQDKLQVSLSRIGIGAKEYSIGKRKQAAKEKLLDQKLLVLEYKTSTEAKLEEARIREENLIRSNEDFKKEIKQQAEETNKLLKQMMEMFQNQVKP